MTEKEIRRLSRDDLMEMIVSLLKENGELKKRVELLDNTVIEMSNDREKMSLAEAALRMSGIFEAADVAAEKYQSLVRERFKNVSGNTDG